MIRLLIVAASAVVRAGLEALATSRPDIQVVGVLPDFNEGEALHPDVVLAAVPWDDSFPRPTDRAVPVVLITADSHPLWSPEAFRLGVRALLSQDASQAEILAAVEAAANGFAALDPQELSEMLSSATPAHATGESAAITTRELDVLRMMAEGAPNKIIAWKLGISEHTVKFHVASILSKLGASSRTEAVAIGIRRGLILL